MILRSAGGLLRSDDVAEGGDLYPHVRDLEDLGARRQRVEVVESSRREREVEVAASRGEVQRRHRLQQRRVRIELHTVGRVAHAKSRAESPQRASEALEVASVAGGHDVGVVCHRGRPVEHRGESADEHVVNLVVAKRPEQALGIERRGHQRTRRAVATKRLTLATDARRSDGERASCCLIWARSTSSGSRARTRRCPHARAMRCNVERRGSSSPLSHLDTTDWVVPRRAANAACVRPASVRAVRTSAAAVLVTGPSVERFRYE